MKADRDQLQEVEDVGGKVAEFIHSFFAAKQNRAMVKRLRDYGVVWEKLVTTNRRGFFSKKIVVITGSFAAIARSNLRSTLVQAGARVTAKISSKTDYLIVGNNPGSKLQEARKHKVIQLSEDDVLAHL